MSLHTNPCKYVVEYVYIPHASQLLSLQNYLKTWRRTSVARTQFPWTKSVMLMCSSDRWASCNDHISRIIVGFGDFVVAIAVILYLNVRRVWISFMFIESPPLSAIFQVKSSQDGVFQAEAVMQRFEVRLIYFCASSEGWFFASDWSNQHAVSGIFWELCYWYL